MNRANSWKLYFVALILIAFQFANAQDLCRELVWSDEFDYSGLPDTTKWNYDVGDGCDYGLCNWGNLEAQYYTYRDTDNAWVENGSLVIEARKELTVNKKYSSARLVSRDIMDFSHGRIEYRAKLTGGNGPWNTLGVMGNMEKYGWPECGKIDVLNYVGQTPEILSGTVHSESTYGGNGPSGSIVVPDAETEFHVYAIEWNGDSIVWYMDDLQFHKYKNDLSGEASWPFDRSFYLLMNLAVGGTMGGPIDNSIFDGGVLMEVDYVRVYQTAEEAGIRGPEFITINQASLEFSCSIPANNYTWTVPDGVEIVSGQGSPDIVVNWNCVDGNVELEVTTDCETKNLSLPVSVEPLAITGQELVYQQETSLEYSIPAITNGVYKWNLPEDVSVIGPGDSNSILLNWSCESGRVELEVTGSCIDEILGSDVTVQAFELTGPSQVSTGISGVVFETDPLFSGTYTWTVPEQATITDGSDSNAIMVDWGNLPGYVTVELANGCGALRDSIFVNITSDLVIADFDISNPEWSIFGGSLLFTAGNPSATGMNTSDLVGMTYKDAGASSWGGFYTDLESTLDFADGATFSIMVYAAQTGVVLFKLENPGDALVTPIEISRTMTKTNEWEKLSWDFGDAPTNTFNRITLFFDFGQTDGDVFYFDNIALNRAYTDASITLSQDAEIKEKNEDQAVIHVDVEGDIFVETLTQANWTFSRLPYGVSVGSLDRISNTRVDLILSGNSTVDYDTDIQDFSVGITSDELQLNTIPVSTNTGIVFTAVIENPVEEMSAFGFRVYPNPVEQILNIEPGPEYGDQLRGKLLNITGKELTRFTIEDSLYQLDLTPYPASGYIILLNNGFEEKRVLIMHY